MALEDGTDRLNGKRSAAGTAGEPADFEAIYRSEVPSLMRFFRRRLGSHEEADDLAHEALARFLRASPATRIATPQAYLRRIATNLLRDRAERASTRLAQLSVPLVEGFDHPTEYDQHRELEGRQELDHYTAILRQLKPKTLEIFLLSRVDGFTYKEIADKVGMSVWGVKKQMLRAIAHIDQHRRAR